MFTKYRLFQAAALCCVFCLPAALPISLQAQTQSTPPDNSAHNQNQHTTADNQSHTTSDRDTTQQIRKALMADKSLSTYGHNVKIITRNGGVVLKGPVHSEQEKQAIEAHAADIAGHDKVTDQLTVKQ